MLLASMVSAAVSTLAQNLVTEGATAETQMVYHILTNLSGKATICGTNARVDWNTDEAMTVFNWTGQMPAMNCYDFINIHASKDVNPQGWLDYSDMTVVDSWWNSGGLVSCMWHWQVKANNGVNMTCTPGSAEGETSFNISNLYYTSSQEYQQIIHDIDQVSGYLKKMQSLGIPVIWRPLHEASGNCCQYNGGKAWFWWGAKGAEHFKSLWRLMYDRMVNYHGLRNLIWVWTAQTADESWYPGDDVVDVIARDCYGAKAEILAKEYKYLKDTYPGKLISLGECGSLNGTPCATFKEQWKAGCRWSWVTTWYDYAYQYGSDSHMHANKQWWQDFITDDNAIDQAEMYQLMKENGMTCLKQYSIKEMYPNIGWNANYDSNSKIITFTADWGAKGWNIDKDMGDYNKFIIDFSESPTERGTIEGEGIINTAIIPGISRYIMSIEGNHVGNILIKSASAHAQYKIGDAYFAKIEYGQTASVSDLKQETTAYGMAFDITGCTVKKTYHGVIINNGKKYLKN